MDCHPIETAPPDTSLLLWWTPRTPNKYAETWVIGQVSTWEPGKWWNGQTGKYQDLTHITHWMPLPPSPSPSTSPAGD